MGWFSEGFSSLPLVGSSLFADTAADIVLTSLVTGC